MSVASIASALLYLRVTSLRNLIVSRFKRLKQPKYLFGAMAGLVYFYAVLGGRGQRQPGRPSLRDTVNAMSPEFVPVIVTAVALVLLILMLLYWLWPRERAALGFTEAEITFLFPAPLTRKALVHFRLLSVQVRLLFTALVFALVTTSIPLAQPHFVLRLLGWWLLLMVGLLHLMGSSFVLTRLMDRDATPGRSRITVYAVIAALIAIVALLIWREWRAPTLAEVSGAKAAVIYLHSMLSQGVIGVLFAPVRWIVQPLVTQSASAFWLALGPAAVIYALHYWWVLNTEVAFEEGSIAHAQKRATRISAFRSGNMSIISTKKTSRTAPFNLAATPRVELAFLWKNLLNTSKSLQPRVLLVAGVVMAMACVWLKRSDHDVITTTVGMMSLTLGMIVLMMGALYARQDFRSDMPNVDILKAYPLRGWQVVVGQMMTPIVIMTLLMWVLLLAIGLTMEPNSPRLSHAVWILGMSAAAILIPLFLTIQVLVQNGFAVLFPAWGSFDKTGGGIDVMGQRMLMMLALLLSIAAMLLVPSIVAAILYFVTIWFVGVVVASVLAFVLFVVTLVAQLAWCVTLLGRQFEKLDLSAELRP